jgi:hypothetical protein
VIDTVIPNCLYETIEVKLQANTTDIIDHGL